MHPQCPQGCAERRPCVLAVTRTLTRSPCQDSDPPGLLTLCLSATELVSTPVRPGHLECVRKQSPRCRSSSSRGSSLPCRQGGRRRRLNSASSSKRALCRRLGGASACCRVRRTVRGRRRRRSAPARTAFAVPFRTLRTRLLAPWLCSFCRCSCGSAPKLQCSVLSAMMIRLWRDYRRGPHRYPAFSPLRDSACRGRPRRACIGPSCSRGFAQEHCVGSWDRWGCS